MGGVPVLFQLPMKPKVVEPPAGMEPFQAALVKVKAGGRRRGWSSRDWVMFTPGG